MKKRCAACRKVKPLSAFHRSKNNDQYGRHSRCKSCRSQDDARARMLDPDSFRERSRRYRHSEHGKEQAKKYRTTTREEMREYQRAWHFKNKYGITIEDFDALLKRQKNRCAVCRRRSSGRTLHVDHNHDTGEVRGLLCSPCNLAIGLAGDDPDRLVGMAAYLIERDGGRVVEKRTLRTLAELVRG